MLRLWLFKKIEKDKLAEARFTEVVIKLNRQVLKHSKNCMGCDHSIRGNVVVT